MYRPSIITSTSGFLSTPSARRATAGAGRQSWLQGYFYPRPPRGGRLCDDRRRNRPDGISIHALREEGDHRTPSRRHLCQLISIHALREEGDFIAVAKTRCFYYFYPRPPRGGRRTIPTKRPFWNGYFYPRPPRGGRHVKQEGLTLTFPFLSTPSARRATPGHSGYELERRDFYPRPPRGGRRAARIAAYKGWVFLSTPSARRATFLLWEAERWQNLFLSTPSARRATWRQEDE